MSRDLHAALLAVIEQDAEARRAEEQLVSDAGRRADQVRRDTREERDSRSLAQLAEAFTRIADSLQKIAAIGIDVRR